jgi:hypothetical protein
VVYATPIGLDRHDCPTARAFAHSNLHPPNRKPTPAGKLKVGLLNKKRCADSSTPLAPWQDVCSVAQRAAEDIYAAA